VADTSARTLRFPEDDDVVELGYARDLYLLLQAIDETMPGDAVLYIEGTSIDAAIRDFLERRSVQEPPLIETGTLWPRPGTFHLPLSASYLADLRSMAASLAEPEIADHLVVYRGVDVLLWAHDAGGGYIRLARSLPQDVVDRFREILGTSLRR
jgi:hypothetical protein